MQINAPAQDAIRQAHKMEAFGQLAEGLAHEFNKYLTVIQGYSSLLLADENLEPEKRSALTNIYAAGERAAGLSRQIQVFSRKRAPRRQTLDMNEVAADAAKMLHGILGGGIALHLNRAVALPPVSADPGMIEQVFLNLAENAREAMPKGGQLHIHTAHVVIEGGAVRRNPEARPGDFVCLSVRDTGCGITPEVMPRIFEPFFTTKKPGKGIGLGLAVVYGIVKQHEGWVEVESQPGAGTTFHVFLPALASQVVTGKPAPSKPAQGTETILLVEDEEPTRGLAALVLQRCGYRVLEAACGAEALEVWGRHQARIELLLTDLVMPDDLTGPEIARKMLEEKPALKVVYTSAYSREITGEMFKAQEEIQFLPKPYHPEKLAETVRQALDGTSKEIK
jgi:two-component system cell cycle sensor histidine kinase/response regulator CckA